MKKPLLFIASLLTFGFAGAQTVHHIEVGGGPSGPAPYYSPQFITIEVGDTVRWTNSGGTHNVDGSLAAYPNNPEGFTSGNPSSSLWIFDHVFTMDGSYGFECSAFNHADTQFGKITVEEPNSVEESEAVWSLYPNPATDYLLIHAQKPLTSVSLYSLDMKLVADLSITGSSGNYRIAIDNINRGSYLMQCNFDGELSQQMVVIQ